MTGRRDRLTRERRGSAAFSHPHIPIDYFRTIAYVIKLRSQTRAAKALGISQPTVSTHIKNLQEALGSEIFDKSVPGVTLTQIGKAVVKHAQTILELHDDLFRISARGQPPRRVVRIGIHRGLLEATLPAVLKRCSQNWPGLSFEVTSDLSENLLAALEADELDIALASAIVEPDVTPRHRWAIELVWVCSAGFELKAGDPVPLVSYSGNSRLTQVATSALEQAGLAFEIVYGCSSGDALATAVASGLGIAVMPRGALPPVPDSHPRGLFQQLRTTPQTPLTAEIAICANSFLPKLPSLIFGIYRRSVHDTAVYDEVADAIAEVVNGPQDDLTRDVA
jgi:DNA-binding transcriptional LysR family regulator